MSSANQSGLLVSSNIHMKSIIDATPHCSSIASPFKQFIREDLSWKEYLYDIYNVNVKNHDDIQNLTKHLLTNNDPVAYYRYGNVDTKLVEVAYPNWQMTNHYMSKSAFSVDIHYEESRRGIPIKYDSYSWVEVHHFASNFFPSFGTIPYNEGYSTGYMYTAHIDNYSYVPYGCWFHVIKGTGVFINIGKTLAIEDNVELFKYLDLDSHGCIEGVDCGELEYVDKYLCTKALQLHYDSIQLFRDNLNELIICSGNCAQIPINSSCPDIPLRGGFNHSKSCDCNDKFSLMNCGVDYARPEFYDGIPKKMVNMNRHFTCIRENYLDVVKTFQEKEYEFKFAFTSNIIKYLSLHHHDNSSVNSTSDNDSSNSHIRKSHDPSSKHYIEMALNKISNEYHLMLDISHSTSYHSSGTDIDEDNLLTNSLGYTLLPYYNNLHLNLKPLEKKYIHQRISNNSFGIDDSISTHDISNLRRRRRTSSYHIDRRLNEHNDNTTSTDILKVAITSNSIIIGNIKVRILSIVSTDDWLTNLTLQEVEKLYMNEPEFNRWIIDEAMCLRNQEADIIIMISKASFNLNKHIFEKAHGYVDIIIGSNPYLKHHSSCNGQYHLFTNNSNELWMNGLVQVMIMNSIMICCNVSILSLHS